MSSNILYIEDHPDNMEAVRNILELHGYTMLLAMEGIEGVAVAEREKVDLILLDVSLPDMDGYEIIRRIRASTKKTSLGSIPIIAIIPNASGNDAKKALKAGCNMYMIPPINIRDLWARIETYLPRPL